MHVYLSSTGIFLGLIQDQILAPSQLKNEKTLSKMVYIIPEFLVLDFGENFMKIGTKIPIQMHEALHKNVNENKLIFMSFYGGQLKATNM